MPSNELHESSAREPDPGVGTAGTEAQTAGGAAGERATDAAPRSVNAGAPPDSSGYARVARDALPFWLQTLGPAPWLKVRSLNELNPRSSAPRLLRRQSAALGTALLLQLDPDRADRDYLRDAVRMTLIEWQRSFRMGGAPAHRHLPRSPLHGLITATVITLLGETTEFQTALLLRDIERHLGWLVKQPARTPWLEAARIVALADGAFLVRRSEWLACARKQLGVLLARQSIEGWFPERGGADVGRLSLTVDALARLQRNHGWAELDAPIVRAVRFLTNAVHPNGRFGGCYGTCHTSFLSPYGVELLAETLPDAARLAAFARESCCGATAGSLFGHDDDLWTILGARLALSAVHATRLGTQVPAWHESYGVARFERTGWSIVSNEAYYAVVNTKKGGAVRVTWRDGSPDLEDAGVTVIYPHRVQTSLRFDRRARSSSAEDSVKCHGILRGIVRTPEWSYEWFKRLLRRWFGEPPVVEPVPSPVDAAVHSGPRTRLTHDRFTREITFGDDWVRIVDRVHCRLPCETIICQSPPPPQPGPFGSGNLASRTRRAPIFVEGGRHVEISRMYRRGRLIDQGSEATRTLD